MANATVERSFSEQEVVDLLNEAGWTITPCTIRRLRRLGVIPYHQFGGRIRYTQTDIDEIIATAHRPAQSSAKHGELEVYESDRRSITQRVIPRLVDQHP